MAEHIIVGAGAIGTATARQLAQHGEHVVIVSRHGSGPEHPAITRIAADATDADRLTELARGAQALYNCASPQYHQWFTDWPPLARALITAAERSGAVLASMSNLYGYIPSGEPITERSPVSATHPKLLLRAQMWDDQLAAQQAGRIRTTEVRASDYIEANGLLSFGLGAPLLSGRRAYSPAPLDVPHSWTSIEDCARALVTVAGDERAHGKFWLVPTAAPMTVRDLAVRFAAAAGAPPARISAIPYPVLWTYGLFSPMVRELRITRHQFTRPFVLDASATTRAFGLQPRPVEESLADAAARLRP